MRALAVALWWVAGAIADDWNTHGIHVAGGWDRARVLDTMQHLALGAPEHGIAGFIHPRCTPARPRLFGAWSF